MYFFQADQGITDVTIWQSSTPEETPSDVANCVVETSDLEDATQAISITDKSRNVADDKSLAPRRKSSNIRNETGDHDFAALPNSKLEQVKLRAIAIFNLLLREHS